ncbi:hypothetical protein TSTA_024610 [Talaromyces stipitatus ATCC 10500]|nr:uncharacterized protein TSTA_024610 [Talaromyces stipitatus ATCC 10500]EED19138.1 hypothetical protein TSTA_024610 [Talaromyces stipitatus ATCC 10500]
MTSPPGPAFPHDGLMGFFVPGSSFGESTNNWFTNLCSQPHALDECRFGLALELFTNNMNKHDGALYLGGAEHSRFLGELSVTEKHERFVFGDVIFDNQTIHSNAEIMVDSGTTVIWGPIKYVQELFDKAGMQSVLRQSNNTGSLVRTLDGFYSCDHPPSFGFQFPSLANATTARLRKSTVVSHQSRVFQIYYSALAENSSEDGGNCRASIHGTDSFGDSWIVGQRFFRGRYIDHNVEENTMGFADLQEIKKLI